MNNISLYDKARKSDALLENSAILTREVSHLRDVTTRNMTHK